MEHTTGADNLNHIVTCNFGLWGKCDRKWSILIIAKYIRGRPKE